MLYSQKATIFNYNYSNGLFYSCLLTNVEHQDSYNIDRHTEYNESYDRCLLLVKMSINNDVKSVDGKIFLLPSEWDKLSDKSGKFTIHTDKDFVALGDFSSVEVAELSVFKDAYPDNVFLINGWEEYVSVIPHLEIRTTRNSYGNTI